LKPAQRVTLVNSGGQPLRAGDLEPGQNYVFHYPYVTTPCFLIDLGRPTQSSATLETEAGHRYRWQGGVGPGRSIVAFSAICAHKMSYPTKTVSFINFRGDEARFQDRDKNVATREQVIYCCSEGSVYDPADGARVLGGPAPQPLAAVDLACGDDGVLSACGTYGGDMFERFFDSFEFQLELEHGSRNIQEPVSGTTSVQRLEEYTENQRVC
jgi:Rieske Fe-S protein